MGLSRFLISSSALLLLASACNKLPVAAVTAEKEAAAAPKKAKAGKGHDKPAAPASEEGKGEEKADEQPPQKYTVPFAWETSKAEPLALTRAFLKESFEDNKAYMEHGPKFFAAFADAELPRATVVTCSDSRVQPQAWDETSENDNYTVRNFGNQLVGDEGSIEYGVEQLRTPLLLIIGHTGCGAVKAASGDTSKLSKAMQAQLKSINVPKPGAGKNENQIWVDAVLANVNNQVASGLKKYGKRVQSGSLTVVGAIFDFRNDLGQGAGKFMIVNVNGNSEPERMAAFMAAVNEETPEEAKGKPGKKHAKFTGTAEEAMSSLKQVQGIVAREVSAATNDSAHEH